MTLTTPTEHDVTTTIRGILGMPAHLDYTPLDYADEIAAEALAELDATPESTVTMTGAEYLSTIAIAIRTGEAYARAEVTA